MQNRIRILEPEIANRIAAGEVVQRPASAVKELIENALDAGAKTVQVIVKEAGKSWLQVVDDGEGMTEEDAVLAFQRHATSKINSADDLENIRTLGFRGEALASIAAVAQVELRTRTAEQDTGTLLRIEGSELREKSSVAAERGTNIIVKNLFFNTPARRMFLKTNQTELKNISETVTRMALAYPEIHWLYVSDDEVLLASRPGSAEDRLIDVFGERQFNGLIRVLEATDYLSLDGYIGKPNFARKSRVDQYLYVNRRFVVNKMVNHAVFQAYEHLLEKGTFPFFVLNLKLDPRRIDVNVHPSKLEVKFENESNVYRFVLAVIRKTLAAHNLIPSMALPTGQADVREQRLRFVGAETVESRSSLSGRLGLAPEGVIELDQLFEKIERRMEGGSASTQPEMASVVSRERLVPHEPAPVLTDQQPTKEVRAIWQLHNKYILSQIRTGLLIIDQHVAHERILYERALANFEKDLPSSQQLLFPQTVQLSSHEYVMVKELLPHLERLGFDVKLFGKNTVVVEGIPADVRVGDEAHILQDVLAEYKNNEHRASMDARDNVAKSFACKAAVKAGDRLGTTEMIALIDQLFATSMPYVCPHGRPIVVKIPIEELDKRFGRT